MPRAIFQAYRDRTLPPGQTQNVTNESCHPATAGTYTKPTPINGVRSNKQTNKKEGLMYESSAHTQPLVHAPCRILGTPPQVALEYYRDTEVSTHVGDALMWIDAQGLTREHRCGKWPAVWTDTTIIYVSVTHTHTQSQHR